MAREKDNFPDRRLTTEQSELLLGQLRAGVASGIPLEEIFDALADDLTDRRLQRATRKLADRLSEGADLASAVQSIAGAMPPHLGHALVLGSRTGNLSGILSGLSEGEVVRKRIRRNLWLTISYPLLVMALFLVVMCFISVATIPVFADIYADFDLDLPAMTLLTLTIADNFPLILLLLTLFCAVLLVSTQFFGKRITHWVLGTVPVIGRIWTWSGQHEFSTLMSTLTQHAVPIDEALACATDSLRDQNLARASREAGVKCAAGASLSQAMHESIHFDPTLTLLVAWGESHGSLPLSLREAADTFEQQMQLYNQFLQRVLPPALLCVVSILLFYLVASLLVPLVELINGLTG